MCSKFSMLFYDYVSCPSFMSLIVCHTLFLSALSHECYFMVLTSLLPGVLHFIMQVLTLKLADILTRLLHYTSAALDEPIYYSG